MGRHFEVRAASMAATGKAKSALYMRASKEIYMAAKSGSSTDPNSNLALRSALEKYRGRGIPKEVFDRAIKKAQGGEVEALTSGRYEFMGPGGSLLIVDSLTDNPNRAAVNIKTPIIKKGGKFGAVAFNFTENGVLVFDKASLDASNIEEVLILNDVDVREVNASDTAIQVLVEPSMLAKAKEVLEKESGIKEFTTFEIQMIPQETITLSGENLDLFTAILGELDEVEDVQAVYHNVEI
ncbi:MAG: YebC/PmpR family DNA-binding transcriptional regulator [Erysipelotrichaceae bacterium]|jgi:YebC/PmpR family DNA-binding regulatory protein|nr:YebC/PmpR family DNA-binding transcriptional regulator [Erysipelotrichaceae bacterium]